MTIFVSQSDGGKFIGGMVLTTALPFTLYKKNYELIIHLICILRCI